MKRTITLFVIYILQIIFAICYYIKDIWNSIIASLPFMAIIEEFLGSIVRYLKGFFDFQVFNDLPAIVQTIIIVLLLNIVFTIIFSLVFGLIALIQTNFVRGELENKAQKKFVLSEEERAKFDWKLYIEKFPIRRLISLIVPGFMLYVFLIIRFDVEFCKIEDLYNEGLFTTYSEIKGYISTLTLPLEDVISHYISFNNRMVEMIGITWFEWVIISLGFIVFVLLWWGFFSLFAEPFGEMVAKSKAENAKREYIEKMEMIEYNAWIKSLNENEISEKNKNFYMEDEFNDITALDSSVIGVSLDANKLVGVDSAHLKLKDDVSDQQREYIDDISTGVVDLGIVQEDNVEVRTAILVRETHFVGDEEIDIILEEQPLIEVVEEEYFEEEDVEEETYEKYQPESLLNVNLDDKIKKYYNEVDVKVKEEVAKEEIVEQIENTVKEEIKEVEIKNKIRKDIKPIELNKDRTKIAEYIIKTNKSTLETINENEEKVVNVEENKKVKPISKINKKNKTIKPISPMKVNRK